MPAVILLILLAIGAGVGVGVYRSGIKRVVRRVVSRRGTPDSATVLKQGETVFKTSCGTGYCHGPQGVGGGAPRLQGAGLDNLYIENAVKGGVPGTAMAGFASGLPEPDLTAVVAYVRKLNGMFDASQETAPEAPLNRKINGDAVRGRDLFSDAVRGFGRCSTCHHVNGTGIPVAPRITNVPASVQALRGLATPGVGTVTLAGESMPALIASKNGKEVNFYDLTVVPPVLRTEDSAAASVAAGSGWKHASTMAAYSDGELESILTYLRAAN